MRHLSATVPISVVHGFLARADRSAIGRLAGRSGISHNLLAQPAARVTQEQFATLYRLLALELDDEMPGIFARPLRKGTLKFLCLSLLDAPNLEVALHRFGQFFHLILDEFQILSRREEAHAVVEIVPNPDGPDASPLARELMLKLVHGVASWLIHEKIPLVEAAFNFPRTAQSGDLLNLFPGPVRFERDGTRLIFDSAYLNSAYLNLPIRQRKADLTVFLKRAPEDWIFVSFTEEMVCHQVRQCIAAGLPAVPTVDAVAEKLHYSVRTLCRRLEGEGTSFQAIKDEVRRDISIQRLTRSDDAIASIAYDVGFDNPTAFHRAFRHWTGSTPGAYRETRSG
ncbi:AraC family transcriptional regulator [Caballeronia cordobensis]|uniref:AraC family transcriptional regulator n=1 Tax=Caballeronia cordobensis TaxID=1353886 RepID=UPI0009E73001|nr:AraC family transcriptional regulator [Caballeronia cordobensis]